MGQAPDSTVGCRFCGGASFSVGRRDLPICDYCGQPLAPSGGRCPRCDAVNGPSARACHGCGALLARPCPVCGALNPLDAPSCVVCSQTLATTEALFQRITTKTEDQLRRARDKGHRIKAEEEAASRARLARMWAEEERERQALAEASGRRRQRERRLILVAAVLAGLGILAVLVLSILSESGFSPTF